MLTTVVEKTTNGDLKLKETVTKDELLFLDINVNDFFLKSKFDTEYVDVSEFQIYLVPNLRTHFRSCR